METLLYYLVLGLVRLLQALPLGLVAWLGRRLGALVYWLDARHRRVATENLTLALGLEKTPREIRELVREQFRRIGENYASAVKTASMQARSLARHLQVVGGRRLQSATELDLPASRIFAMGHFGNFELHAWAGHFVAGYQPVATYRALPHPRLDALLRSLRERAGCLVFERRTEGAELRKLLTRPGLMVGLLCDQHAGASGIWLPFFGRECSTSPAPAVLAQRYRIPLHTAICFRTGLARWRIEIGDEIPTFEHGRRRAVADVMRDVNLAFEDAIRRDPANWFWVHRRWKPRSHSAAVRADEPPHAPDEPETQSAPDGTGNPGAGRS